MNVNAELARTHKLVYEIYQDNARGHVNPGDQKELKRLWVHIDKLEVQKAEFLNNWELLAEELPVVD